MGKVVPRSVSNVEDLEELKRFSDIIFQDLIKQVNGNLLFQDNVNVTFADASFNTANAPTTVPHSLGRVPIMWIPGNLSAAGSIYQTQSADAQTLYLASSAVLNARILVF